MSDPRRGGPGQTCLAILLLAYGENFVTKLLTEQRVVFTQNYRQTAEWVIRRYPIMIGVSLNSLASFRAEGVAKDIEVVWAREVNMWSSVSGNVALLEGGPNPNAAKVYLNWLLSKDGQKHWIEATSHNSRRADLPPFDPDLFPKPDRMDQYLRQDEALYAALQRTRALARRLIK